MPVGLEPAPPALATGDVYPGSPFDHGHLAARGLDAADDRLAGIEVDVRAVGDVDPLALGLGDELGLLVLAGPEESVDLSEPREMYENGTPTLCS